VGEVAPDAIIPRIRGESEESDGCVGLISPFLVGGTGVAKYATAGTVVLVGRIWDQDGRAR